MVFTAEGEERKSTSGAAGSSSVSVQQLCVSPRLVSQVVESSGSSQKIMQHLKTAAKTKGKGQLVSVKVRDSGNLNFKLNII